MSSLRLSWKNIKDQLQGNPTISTAYYRLSRHGKTVNGKHLKMLRSS